VINHNQSVLKEAARLLGANSASGGFQHELSAAYNLLLSAAKPKSIYKIVPVTQTETGILLDSVPVNSLDIKRLFSDSSSAVLLACTLGAGVDTLIRQKMVSDMPLATMLDACANADIERICDEIEQQVFATLPNGKFLTRRFSPGYGDLDLQYSSAIVNALDTHRQIGLSLTSHTMLVPSKSVTAIIGISDKKEERFRRCDECAANEDCIYKKRGERCGV